jgi:hypothetical protein
VASVLGDDVGCLAVDSPSVSAVDPLAFDLVGLPAVDDGEEFPCSVEAVGVADRVEGACVVVGSDEDGLAAGPAVGFDVSAAAHWRGLPVGVHL